MIEPLSSIDVFQAAFRRTAVGLASEESEASGVSGDDRAPVGRDVSARFLSPPSVARLYGRGGVLAGENPPGGAGEAESVRTGGRVMADNGGAIMSFSKFVLRDRVAHRDLNVAKREVTSDPSGRTKASESDNKPNAENVGAAGARSRVEVFKQVAMEPVDRFAQLRRRSAYFDYSELANAESNSF